MPTHQKFLALAHSDCILDEVEKIIGPDIVSWGAHIFCKPAGTGLEVPWHQDGQYWPIRPLATSTVWIALDNSDEANGCLRVIRRSHRMKTTYRHKRDARPEYAVEQLIDPDDLDLDLAANVELNAGEMSIHDAYTVHGSLSNRSGKRRAGVTLGYMPATSLYDRSIKKTGGARGLRQDMSIRPIYLVRGRDHARNDFECGQDSPFEVGRSD